MAKNRKKKILGLRKVALLTLLLGILSIMAQIRKVHRALSEISSFEDNGKMDKLDIALVCLACNLQNGNTSETIPFFQNFLPSFCRTASQGYNYTIYIPKQEGTDDDVIVNTFDFNFESCSKNVNVKLRIVPDIDYQVNTGRGLNDIMYIAYLSGASYIYKITNNSTFLSTSHKWTEVYIQELRNRKDNEVGIVFDCKQEFQKCLKKSYFIHKSHMDIFGSVFPPDIMDSDVDHWIFDLYYPNYASNIPITSSALTSDRDLKTINKQDVIKALVIKYKQVLEHYTHSLISSKTKRKDLIISMSLYGNSTRYTYGAIRNAQLARVTFPEWTLRIYIEKRNIQHKQFEVPDYILDKLVDLGVDLFEVNTQNVTLAPMIWRFIVADDLTVDRFIVRDSDSRLTERDAATVQEWLHTVKPFHCIRDHPSHSMHPINGGLFGGQPRYILKMFDKPWSYSKYLEDMKFLNTVVWQKAKKYFYCHDSVSCKKYTSSHPFPVARNGKDHIGAVYDQYNIPRQSDIELMDLKKLPTECKKVSSTKAPEIPTVPTVPTATNTTTRQIVIWSNDFHISPINDLKSFLGAMGVTFIDKSLSGHCHLTKSCAKDLKVLDRRNGINLDGPTVYTKFYETYKDDPEMEKVDAFVCFHPSAMCEIFMPFNKSIIVIPSTRFEMGRHTKDRWYAWNQNLKRISEQPQNTVGANNQYDLEYVRYFTGITPTLLPSYCGYVDSEYNPTRPGYLLSPIRKAGFEKIFLDGFNKAKDVSNVSLTPLRKLYRHYKYSDLSSHQGIVYVPYQVSVRSLFEQYRMNIPLFFPSLDLLSSWQLTYNVMNERTWSSVFGTIPDKSIIPGVLDNVPDPNNDKDLEAIKYWLKYSDFYQWPHIVYFDTYKDLIKKLKTTDLKKVSIGMREFNKKVKTDLTQRWQTILEKVRKFSHHFI